MSCDKPWRWGFVACSSITTGHPYCWSHPLVKSVQSQSSSGALTPPPLLPCCSLLSNAGHPDPGPTFVPHFTTLLLLLLLPNPALLVPTCSYCAHSHGWLRCVTVHIDIVESTVGSKRLVLTRNLLEPVLPVLACLSWPPLIAYNPLHCPMALTAACFPQMWQKVQLTQMLRLFWEDWPNLDNCLGPSCQPCLLIVALNPLCCFILPVCIWPIPLT